MAKGVKAKAAEAEAKAKVKVVEAVKVAVKAMEVTAQLWWNGSGVGG